MFFEYDKEKERCQSMDRVSKIIHLKWAHNHNVTGKGIGVAILDTGIAGHPDFIENNNRIIAFKDIIHHKKMYYDDNGHGTHVSDWKNNKKRKLGKASKYVFLGETIK